MIVSVPLRFAAVILAVTTAVVTSALAQTLDGARSMDARYDLSLDKTELNLAFFPEYLKFVEENPTADRLRNLTYARAAALDKYSGQVLETARRIRAQHPELTAATEALMFPNQDPAVPYVIGEWITEFDLFRTVQPSAMESAKARLFQKASSKGNTEYLTWPQIGGFKSGAGGNRNFQLALTAFIESTFYGRRKFLEKPEFLRFVTMVADAEARQRLFMTYTMRHALLRSRCENLFSAGN